MKKTLIILCCIAALTLLSGCNDDNKNDNIKVKVGNVKVDDNIEVDVGNI